MATGVSYNNPVGFATASVTTVVGLPSIPSGASWCIIQAADANLRWRDDGTDPTASVGMLIFSQQDLVYRGNLAAFRMVADSTAVEVNVAYY